MRAGRATFLLAAIFAAASAVSLAQGRGPGGPPPGGGGGMGGGGMNGGGMGSPPPFGRTSNAPNNAPNGPPPGPPPSSGGKGNQSANGATRGGLQFGPPGLWWDDKSFAKSLKLRPEQQERMDAIFDQNESALRSHYDGLQQAQAQMEEISKSPNLDEGALFMQIDRVAQARAELDKAYTHMLLQIRKEMDADQIARLEKHR